MNSNRYWIPLIIVFVIGFYWWSYMTPTIDQTFELITSLMKDQSSENRLKGLEEMESLCTGYVRNDPDFEPIWDHISEEQKKVMAQFAMAALMDENTAVRNKAIKAVSLFPGQCEQSIPILIDMLNENDSDDKIILEIALSLAELLEYYDSPVNNLEPAVQRLIEGLADTLGLNRRAANALAVYAEFKALDSVSVHKILVLSISHKDSNVKAAAMKVLGECPEYSSTVMPVIIDYLHSEEEVLQAAGASAAGNLVHCYLNFYSPDPLRSLSKLFKFAGCNNIPQAGRAKTTSMKL